MLSVYFYCFQFIYNPKTSSDDTQDSRNDKIQGYLEDATDRNTGIQLDEGIERNEGIGGDVKDCAGEKGTATSRIREMPAVSPPPASLPF